MQVYFEPDKIVPDLPGIITLSHGPVARYIVETVEFLNGSKLENCAQFCLDYEDDPEVFRKEFVKAIELFPEGTIVFCDLFGGTPSNQLLLASQVEESIKGKINGISGMNVPLVLAAALSRSFCKGKELVDMLMADAVNSIVNMNAAIEQVNAAEDDDDDEDDDE